MSNRPLPSDPKALAKFDELREWATLQLATVSLGSHTHAFLEGYCKALADVLVRL